MLNEKKEYAFYLTEGYGGLLHKDNVANYLSGIRHTLTILARGFLTLCQEEGICDICKKDALCQEFLICWMLGKCTLPEYATKRIKSEFEKAKKSSLLNHIVNNKIKVKRVGGCEKGTVAKYLSDKVSFWKNSMFFSIGENSVNEIYFKTIIADALFLGPLTSKKLVIRSDLLNYGIECEKKHIPYINTLLALVASCLQRLNGSNRSAVVKMCELSNYIDRPANNPGGRSSALYSVDGYFSTLNLTYKDAPILTKLPLTGGIVKVFFNEEWLNDLAVRLIDESETVSPPFKAFNDFDLLGERFS